jgi:hypothetical protein
MCAGDFSVNYGSGLAPLLMLPLEGEADVKAGFNFTALN